MFQPQSSASFQENAMANKSLRELQTCKAGVDPKKRLCLLCLSRGPCGILRLRRTFRKMTEDENTQLSYREFLDGLRETVMEISEEEARDMFDEFAADDSGKINIEEFLLAVRPPMLENRVKMVEDAFKKMDKTGEGKITIEELQHVYNVKSNSRYLSGEDSEEKLLTKFLMNFEQEGINDGYVTKEEFMDYYSAISTSIVNGGYFDLMMRQAYKL